MGGNLRQKLTVAVLVSFGTGVATAGIKLVDSSHEEERVSPNLESVSTWRLGMYLWGLHKVARSINEPGSPHHWFDEVPLPDGFNAKLFLGALPLKSDPGSGVVFEQILAAGVKSVLSINDIFEIEARTNPGFLMRTFGSEFIPVTQQDWKEAGIIQKNIHSPDFAPVSLRDVEAGVEFIAAQIGHGNSTYVHCKAGQGRSAMTAAAFLVKYAGYTPKGAVELLKSARQRVRLNGEQYDGLVEFADKLEASRRQEL